MLRVLRFFVLIFLDPMYVMYVFFAPRLPPSFFLLSFGIYLSCHFFSIKPLFSCPMKGYVVLALVCVPHDLGCVVETYWLSIGRPSSDASRRPSIPLLSPPLMRATYHLIDIHDFLRYIHRFHARSCIYPALTFIITILHYLFFC
jgi:hypothetical protein